MREGLKKKTIKVLDNGIYRYSCPESLGFLEISLDGLGKVKRCIFIDEKNENKSKDSDLPEIIKKALDDYFNKKKDLPSNLISKEVSGTDFQKHIWGVISKLKFGETIIYTEMAERAGRSLAIRAAGTACGKNPLALFIPCHRVVRKQNEDYGYSWGVSRKKWLLNFEGVNF